MTTFRNFRLISTGQWLDVLLTMDGDMFSVAAISHRTDIAAGFGLLLADVEVVDGPADARTGVLIPAPIPAPAPLKPDQIAWTAATVADRVTMLGKYARFIP